MSSSSSSSSSSSYSPPIIRVPIPTSITRPIGDPESIVFSEKNIADIRTVAQKGLEVSSVSTTKYIASLPAKVLLSKTAYACEYGLAGGIVGAVAGAGIGSAAAGIGAVPGAIGGGMIGYCGGVIYGSVRVHRETRREFEKWKKDKNTATINEFRQMFKDHSALEMCIDPISTEPMVLPAHCNCPDIQHTMDYETLQESLRRHRICPLDLMQRTVPAESEIRIDYRSLGVFNLAYAELLQAGAKKAKLSSDLARGVAALVDDLHRHRVFLFERENHDIQSKISLTMKRKVSNVDEILSQSNQMMILSTRLNIITQLLFPLKVSQTIESTKR